MDYPLTTLTLAFARNGSLYEENIQLQGQSFLKGKQKIGQIS